MSKSEIAAKFAEAAKSYENNPVAIQLRAMNIFYECLKEKGALVVPSTAVETMGLGTITGLTSMAKYPPAWRWIVLVAIMYYYLGIKTSNDTMVNI